MFKRRTPRSTLASVGRSLWPRGGWLRAVRYVVYRIRRLPDPAHKISRGIAAGVFVCFTPFFGLHFLISAGLAWLIGGNVLAAILATFTGNPITFPVIAGLSVHLGSWILGEPATLPLDDVFGSFSSVSLELWFNAKSGLTGGPVHWMHMSSFFENVFMPYLVGGIGPGLVSAMIVYAVSRPIITAYQNARIARLREKIAQRHGVAGTGIGDREGQG